MQQTVHAVEIHEHPEIGDVFDHADDLVARLDAIEELLALLGALGLDDLAAGEHDVFPVVVDFDDLELVNLADVFVEVLRRDDVDLAAGQEGLDADVDHETALHDGLHLALHETTVLIDLVNLVPVLAMRGLFLGEDDHALIVFEAFEEDFDFVADLNVLVFKLVGRDGPFRFVADVHQDDLRLDFQNAALDDGAFGERPE